MAKQEQALTRGAAQTDALDGMKTEQAAELQTQRDSARSMAEIQAAAVLASRNPRDEDRAYAGLMRAVKRTTFAAKALYRFPRGGSDISGPTVGLAREFARLWGNMRYGIEITRDDDDTRTLRGWAWDVQTNAQTEGADTFQKLIFRKPNPSKGIAGGWSKPDERDLRELTNRRAAFIVRNCLLSLLPPDMIEDALVQVRETLASDMKANPRDRIKKLIVAFDEITVTVAMLAEYLGCAPSDMTGEQFADLTGIYRSIRDGNSKREEYFGKAGPEAETLPGDAAPTVTGAGAAPPRQQEAPKAPAADAGPTPHEQAAVTLREIVEGMEPKESDKWLRSCGIAGMDGIGAASVETLQAAIDIVKAQKARKRAGK